MQRDLRETAYYKEIAAYYRQLYEPGFGRVTYAGELALSRDSRRAAFTGSILKTLKGVARFQICMVDLTSAKVENIGPSRGTSTGPKFSPNGRYLAFISDTGPSGFPQGFVLDLQNGSEPRALPEIDGVVEYLHWSPDGHRLLLGVAGRGADLAGMQGATTTPGQRDALPDWIPEIRSGAAENEWRRLWVCNLDDRSCHCITPAGRNVWEAGWCGPNEIIAVVSDAPDEAAWYTANLYRLPADGAGEQVVHRPQNQLGIPVASPSGAAVAVIEAVCSDRMVVAGEVYLGVNGRDVTRIDTMGVDVTHQVWRDDDRLLFIGEGAFETVVGEYDLSSGRSRLVWASEETHSGFWYPAVAPYGKDECAFIAEGYLRPPSLAVSVGGELRDVVTFAHGETSANLSSGLYGHRVEKAIWSAPDGQEIHGWLILPDGEGPFPVIMEVHGGPVWSNRSRWMGGVRAEPQALVYRGYAVFRPNPRGSGGRGQAFARQVVGDMGGKDTGDLLSGLDALVERGIADPDRLAVIGVSYGGFMASWIITQDDRFAASVPMSPVTNWVSMQWTSNVPHFVRTFLDNEPTKPDGLYHRRSPVSFADRVRTPTLLMAGALDRISPPSQAEEFYAALRDFGAEAAYVCYPREGHNIRSMPATIDAAARIAAWFDHHLRMGDKK